MDRQARAAQAQLIYAWARADKAGREALLEAARAVARGSDRPWLRQAAAGLLRLAATAARA